jgi:hypothetical protein
MLITAFCVAYDRLTNFAVFEISNCFIVPVENRIMVLAIRTKKTQKTPSSGGRSTPVALP